jgi:hypothetical protein
MKAQREEEEKKRKKCPLSLSLLWAIALSPFSLLVAGNRNRPSPSPPSLHLLTPTQSSSAGRSSRWMSIVSSTFFPLIGPHFSPAMCDRRRSQGLSQLFLSGPPPAASLRAYDSSPNRRAVSHGDDSQRSNYLRGEARHAVPHREEHEGRAGKRQFRT